MDSSDPHNDPSEQSGTPKQAYAKNYEAVEYDYHKEKHVVRNILIVLTVLVIGFAVYWFILRQPTQPVVPAGATSQSQADTQPKETITTETKQHRSKKFSLRFDYPADWKVTEDETAGTLKAVSPAINLMGADGISTPGQVILLFRSAGQPIAEFDTGNAVAVRTSERITYAQPGASQRGSTHISFLAYSNSTNTSAIDSVYVTGDSGYQSGQAVPLVDISKVNPIITISFQRCSDDQCSSSTLPLAISSSMWDNPAFSGSLKKILESLVVG